MKSTIIAIIATLGLFAASTLIGSEIGQLKMNIERCEATIQQLNVDLAKSRDALSVMQKLVMVNAHQIQTLRPKRTVVVTAYTASGAETDDTPEITASNRKVRPGIIAVSRNLFDSGWVFGKKVYIKSLGIFTIDDLMAESKTDRIDVFMPDLDTANKFGARQLDVYLLDA
jgi:3D (Asp-Asp-Asp) domain-containing protein